VIGREFGYDLIEPVAQAEPSEQQLVPEVYDEFRHRSAIAPGLHVSYSGA
jgi:hypothetical protein